MGLLTFTYPAARTGLERASDLFRSFREQPAPGLAQSARAGLATALSPNERLQQLPWTSYVIVPLFALANAGILVSGVLLARTYTSPVLIGYVSGKPLGDCPDRISVGALAICVGVNAAASHLTPSASRMPSPRPAPSRRLPPHDLDLALATFLLKIPTPRFLVRDRPAGQSP
jgi:hypothetical protein